MSDTANTQENPDPDTQPGSLGPGNGEQPRVAPTCWAFVAALLVVILAFLLASSPARNSEIWRHLATGRALFAGTYTFGIDPFAYTTEGLTWVNHSWLWDVASYVTFRWGTERLVFVNALLAVGIAVFLLLNSKVFLHPIVASIVVAGALVAMAPQLTLSPTMVSYFMFAFILWQMDRIQHAPNRLNSLQAYAPLCFVITLWVNCDEWFVLGPIVIGVHALSNTTSNPNNRARRNLLIVFVLSVALCLINPHHVRIFHVPTALGTAHPLAPEIARSPAISVQSMSWLEVNGPLAAYGLLVISSVWVLLQGRARTWSDILIITAFLGLSLYRSAAIPFFVIFVGPMLARNLQVIIAAPAEAARNDMQNSPSSARFAWVRPLLGTTTLLALVAMACPGWLQGSFDPRGWHVHADPSMKRLAQGMAIRHDQGQLGPTTRGFNVSIDMAHYMEWFCPEEKVFLDGRFHLFPLEVVGEYQQIGDTLTGDKPNPVVWNAIVALLNRRGITHLVVADPIDRRLASALRNLWQRPDDWIPFDMQGRALAFGMSSKSDAQRGRRWSSIDLHSQAFGVESATISPRRGPGREPRRRSAWDCIVWAESEDAQLDRDKAIIAITHFESLRDSYQERHRRMWEAELLAGQLALFSPQQPSIISSVSGCFSYGLVSASASPVPASGSTPLHALSFQLFSLHMQHVDKGPPGSLFLAIRAARKSIHENPDDPLAYLRLGLAYKRLRELTLEGGYASNVSLLEPLRRAQTLVALHRAVQLKPGLMSGHELLAGMLEESQGLDLALPHVQALLSLTKSAGPRADESAADFSARVEKLVEREQKLGKLVRELLNFVDTQGFKLDVFAKANLAANAGLPGYALELLLRSSYADFGREGAILQLRLLLFAGRPQDFRSLMDPAFESKMGTSDYRALQMFLAAADGDYDEADGHLQRIIVSTIDVPDLGIRKVAPRTALSLILSQQVLNGGSIHPFQPIMQAFSLAPWETHESRGVFLRRLDGIMGVERLNADIQTLRGLLLLESGAIQTAQRAFSDALAAWDNKSGSGAIARHYLNLITGK